jgi:endonuclease YncB( thermonuclease family)
MASDENTETHLSSSTNDILDQENIPWFSLKGKFLYCKVINVYDGDSITMAVPINGSPYKMKCRLEYIDTPEIRTKNLHEKAKGLAARDWLREQINDKKLWVMCGDFDKYGRLLCNLFTTEEKKNSINEQLVNLGYAHHYDGGKKQPW